LREDVSTAEACLLKKVRKGRLAMKEAICPKKVLLCGFII
jgi:hypothetical protein